MFAMTLASKMLMTTVLSLPLTANFILKQLGLIQKERYVHVCEILLYFFVFRTQMTHTKHNESFENFNINNKKNTHTQPIDSYAWSSFE